MEREDHGRQEAEAQLASIRTMVARLRHAQECDGGEDCELTDEEIREALDYYGQPITEEARAEYHDQDKANEAIYEDPLDVQVRSAWQGVGETLEPAEYCLLLCTGGPACRIIGDLDESGEVHSARLQYQDWGTPWTEYITTGEDHEALLTYARQFYFA